MNPIPAELQARREIEDRAAQLGEDRSQIQAQLTENTWAMMELLRTRQHTLIPLDHLANLLGVSRQSLYRWREIARNIPPDRTVADWLTETDETGAFVHYYG
jgi:hypothetical protein